MLFAMFCHSCDLNRNVIVTNSLISEMDSGQFSLNSADNKGILSLLSAIEQTGDNFETDPESPEPIKDHIDGHEAAFNQLEGNEWNVFGKNKP